MTNVDKHPKSGVYRFRRAVPKKLRAILGKTEIVESLGTKDVAEAKRRAKPVGIRVDKLFEAASQGKVGITRSEASQIVQAWKYEQLKRDEEERLAAPAFTGAVAETVYEIENFTNLCLRLEELKRAEDRCDYAAIKPDLSGLLTASGKFIDPKSGAFQLFAGMLFKASREVIEEQIRRSQGDWSAFNTGIQVTPPSQRSAPMIHADSPPLSQIHSLWEEETQPPEKTKSDWKTAIRRFSEVAGGDIPIGQITKQHGRDFKQSMQKFPRALKGKHRQMTVPEILADIRNKNGVEKLSDQTVNKHIAALASVFSWAIDNGYIDSNPMTGLKIKQRNNRDRRLPYAYYQAMIQRFTPREIQIMLDLPNTKTVVSGRISSSARCKKKFKEIVGLLDASSIPTPVKTAYANWMK